VKRVVVITLLTHSKELNM